MFAAAHNSSMRAFQRRLRCYVAVAMDTRPPIPVPGLAIALITVIALILAGVEPALGVAILTLWGGSLFLSTARAPESRPPSNGQTQLGVAVRELIEHSAIPPLRTEGGRIPVANQAAIEVLGEQSGRAACRES